MYSAYQINKKYMFAKYVLIIYMDFLYSFTRDFWLKSSSSKKRSFRKQHIFKLGRSGISYIPYTRHYNPLLIRNPSWLLTIHKGRLFWKKLLEKTFLTFKKWVWNIQTASYNGAHTVIDSRWLSRRTQKFL